MTTLAQLLRARLAAAAGLCALLLAAASAAQLARPPVVVEASVEPRAVMIGTPVRYTLRITADPTAELAIPSFAGRIGAFQVVNFDDAPKREVGGRAVLERWFTLVTYAVGEHAIPGPTVQYRIGGGEPQAATAPDVAVAVQSLVQPPGATPATDVRDIKGPVAVPSDYRALAWIGVAALLLLGVIAFLYRWLNRPRRAPEAIARPPHEIALEALSRLHAARLLEEGKHEEFYVRLSGIVRDYLEARFHLRAPEMTTEEFLQAAQRNPQLTPSQRGQLGNFLAEADLVKFARYRPAATDGERAYGAAREFVHSTTPEVPRAAA
ncbi:MAG: hypothetical protein AB7V27_08195 [Candidatus Binatia bacterium]